VLIFNVNARKRLLQMQNVFFKSSGRRGFSPDLTGELTSLPDPIADGEGLPKPPHPSGPAVRLGPLSESASVCHKSQFCRNGPTNQAGFRHGRLLSTYPALCFGEILVLPFGALSQTVDLTDLATAVARS